VLISPWISFDTTSPSFMHNAESDYITVTSLNRASKAFIGPDGTIDDYAEPVQVSPRMWREVAAVVDEIMVWGGGGEILIDGIRTFADHIANGFAEADDGAAAGSYAAAAGAARGRQRVFYVETSRASHEEQIMDYTLRVKKKSQGALVIEDWINSRL
jgi:hypothetical protein